MEWREAQHSWSARPGLLMCPSNGIFRKRTATGDERFVAPHITFPLSAVRLKQNASFDKEIAEFLQD